MRVLVHHLRRHVLAVALLPLAVLLAGCTATGGGSIPSNDPTAKATFGFSFDAPLDAPTSTFSGSYHDPQGVVSLLGVVDVAFKGTGQLHKCTPSDPLCATAPPAKGGCIAGEPSYQSQNPAIPGGGTVFLFLCDLDGGGVTGDGTDSIFLQVETGPYTGYTNSGNPSGNITVKS